MLEFEDIQHILLTRAPALTGRYEFLSFRNAAGGRAWLGHGAYHRPAARAQDTFAAPVPSRASCGAGLRRRDRRGSCSAIVQRLFHHQAQRHGRMWSCRVNRGVPHAKR
jgi:hypothetical protein